MSAWAPWVIATVNGERYALEGMAHRGPHLGPGPAGLDLRIAPAGMLPRPSRQRELKGVGLMALEDREQRRWRQRLVSCLWAR